MNRLSLAAVALVFAWPAGGRAQTVAIRGGLVHPVSGPRLDDATVLIRDGQIVAVGRDVEVPEGARLIDASGRWVTPGIIAGFTRLGLVEISRVPGTVESSFGESAVSASFNILDGINPASQLIPVTRVDGVTTVVSGPRGGLVAGQAVVVDLVGESVSEMVVRSPAAVVAALDEGASEAGGGSRAGSIARLRTLIDDARDYEARRNDYLRGQTQELSAPGADLEALLLVLNREVPLLVEAHRRGDIESALRLASDYELDLILLGADEAYQVAAQLAEAAVPVIINPLSDIPSYDAPSPRLENAALLLGAGVRVILISGDLSHNVRNILQAAGNAVAYGMDWDAALQGVTLAPALAFGIGDRYGSLEPGKVANVVVWSGDPFELSTGVESLFIRGREIPLTSRQRELMERYKTLPPTF